MRDGFVPLAQWLAPPALPVEPPPTGEMVAEDEKTSPIFDAIADVRRFRAALADALDASLDQLLCDVAAEVVGRELLLAPADVRAVVRRARERFALDDPVRIRVHPDDCAALDGETTAIVADERLRRGDVVLEVASGTIDARLGVRLESLLVKYAVR